MDVEHDCFLDLVFASLRDAAAGGYDAQAVQLTALEHPLH